MAGTLVLRPTTVDRAAVLRAIAESPLCLDNGTVLELEHAIFCFSCNNEIPYRRDVFRILYMSERHPDVVRAFLVKHSSVALVALPQITSLQSPPTPVQCASIFHCEERLAAYVAQGTVELPDAGTKCARCKSCDVRFEMLQTRSADEAITIFCCCENCGKRWRM